MIVDSLELLRMIRDGEIKAGTEIIFGKQKLYFDGDNIVFKEGKTKLLSILWDKNFANSDFEILSEQDEEINIEAIEELSAEISYRTPNSAFVWSDREKIIVEQQNKILKAVKQLNKKIK